MPMQQDSQISDNIYECGSMFASMFVCIENFKYADNNFKCMLYFFSAYLSIIHKTLFTIYFFFFVKYNVENPFPSRTGFGVSC